MDSGAVAGTQSPWVWVHECGQRGGGGRGGRHSACWARGIRGDAPPRGGRALSPPASLPDARGVLARGRPADRRICGRVFTRAGRGSRARAAAAATAMAMAARTRAPVVATAAHTRRGGARGAQRGAVRRRSNSAALASLATQPVGDTALESINAYGEAVDASSQGSLDAGFVCSSNLLKQLTDQGNGKSAAETVYSQLNKGQWDTCLAEPGYGLWDCVLDNAMANQAIELAPKVAGRVVLATRTCHAHDADALVRYCEHMLRLIGQGGVADAKSKVLFRMPATYDAIEAARRLEAAGTAQCDVSAATGVHAAAAIDAGCSSVTVQVGTADTIGGDGAGPELVAQAYALAEVAGQKTKVVAASVRSAAKAVECCGVDYVLVPAAIIADLKERAPVPRNVGGTLDVPVVESVDGGREEFEEAAGAEATCAVQEGIQQEADDEVSFKKYMAEVYNATGQF